MPRSRPVGAHVGGKGEDQKGTKEEVGTSEVMISELRCKLRGATRSRGVCLFGASSAR